MRVRGHGLPANGVRAELERRDGRDDGGAVHAGRPREVLADAVQDLDGAREDRHVLIEAQADRARPALDFRAEVR